MISLKETHSALCARHLSDCMAFLDSQRLRGPSRNDQVQFDFQGLRQSYRHDPAHPESRFVASFSRIWIYDLALCIHADLSAGRLPQAGTQARRAAALARREEARGFEGLWHFSYNTRGDSFIDTRGPAGANAWALSAVYATILRSGQTDLLPWVNRAVQRYLFGQQLLEPAHPCHGLIRAGLHNAQDIARQETTGYTVYEGDPNRPYDHAILEHNIDAAAAYRLAFRATQRFDPGAEGFLRELIRRHDLLMQGIRRCFWKGDHFVSALDGQGQPFLGTDGSPSVAIDNNTWAAQVFLPYAPEMAWASCRYVEKRFVIRTPHARIEDLPPHTTLPSRRMEGVYFFPASFCDPFVEVQPEHRPKMERVFQLEASFGYTLFLQEFSHYVSDPADRAFLRERAWELYEQAVNLQRLYGPDAAPYATGNVPAVLSTLSTNTTAATGAVAAAVFSGDSEVGADFIGAVPPPEFLVDGLTPLIRR